MNKYLQQLPEEKHALFKKLYRKKKKSVILAYVFWLLLGAQYLYLRQYGKYFFYLASFLIIIGIFWRIADFFRIPFMVAEYNEDQALDIYNKIK